MLIVVHLRSFISILSFISCILGRCSVFATLSHKDNYNNRYKHLRSPFLMADVISSDDVYRSRLGEAAIDRRRGKAGDGFGAGGEAEEDLTR